MTVELRKTPIAWLERCYDQWVIQSLPSPEVDGITVWVSNRYNLTDRQTVGVSHTQAWIRIKNDLVNVPNEAEAQWYYNCRTCDRNEHSCMRCAGEATHMSGDVCVSCTNVQWCREGVLEEY